MTRKQFLGAQFDYLMKHGSLDAGFWCRADIVCYMESQNPRQIDRKTYDRLVNDGPSIGRLTYGND